MCLQNEFEQYFNVCKKQDKRRVINIKFLRTSFLVCFFGLQLLFFFEESRDRIFKNKFKSPCLGKWAFRFSKNFN